MANMTGLGKYQRGLALEKEGLSAKEIAGRLGLKDAQAWYAMKNYYSKRNAAFNARAAGEQSAMDAETSGVQPVLMPEVVPVKAAITAELVAATMDMLKPKKPKLKISFATKAEGEFFDYILNDKGLAIFKKGTETPGLTLPQEDALTMLEELKELLKA